MPINATTDAQKAFLSELIKAYQAGLGRMPDNAGLEYWYNVGVSNGYDLIATTKGFLPPEVLMQSPGHFIDDLYHSVLGRDADLAGYNYWTQKLASGAMTKQEVMLSFALSQEFGTAVAQGVYDTMQKAIAGTPIDTSHPLAGIPVYDYTPKPPVEVIKEVPVEVIKIVDHYIDVPVIEKHVVTADVDGTASTLAQKANGDLLVGTGIPANNMQLVVDHTSNIELALGLMHRQSAEDVNPDSWTFTDGALVGNYHIDAGTQNGLHNNPVNANRSEASIKYAISGGPGALSDGDTRIDMVLMKDGALVNTLTLAAINPDGSHIWKDKNGNIVIADDPASQYSAVNSQNMAFGHMFGQADLPAGEYDVTLQTVQLTGVLSGQVTASNTVHFTAVAL